MSDLDRALKELSDAQKGYQEAEDHFEGDPAEVFGSPKLKRALARTGTHWRLPFGRTVVTAVRDRMELLAVTSSEERVASYFQEVWDANQLDEESDDVTQWGLVYGECYLLVWPGEDAGTVQADYNSPRVMRLFYDEETGKRKEFAAKVWVRSDGRTRANLYYRDRLEKYVSKGKDAKEGKDYEPYVDLWRDAGLEGDEPEAVWPIPNEYDRVPVFHFRTQRPHGRPEHKDAYSPQSMVNKLVIGLMAGTDFQGFPQRWAIAGEAEVDDSELDDDDLAFLEGNPDAGDEVERNSTALKSGPGELWWLQGVKNVGQFDAADPEAAYLKPLRFILESMGSLTSTPTDFFLSAEGSAPSGESRRVSHAPLTKKVGDRKQTFGSTWQEAFAFIAVVGLDLEEEPDVALTWAPTESYDDGDSWEVAKKKQDAGVPKKRTLVEQGYSQEAVDAWYPEEEADEVSVDVLHERIQLLGQLAEASQKLGMAVTMGVMTAEQASQTMASFLQEAQLPEEG